LHIIGNCLTSTDRRVTDLEDELRQRDRRISELKSELESERDLLEQMSDQIQRCNETIESWKHAFDMVLNDEGMWTWDPKYTNGLEWVEKYQALVDKWNKFVGEYNSTVRKRNVGRPLAASDAQCETVRKLHKAGTSLRDIAEETNLGLNTVRTIIGRVNGTDRTTVKHLTKIDPERTKAKSWKSKLQQRNELPKRIHELQKDGAKLLKEAKGSVGQAA
jgi:hypothetical protein